MKQKNKMLSTHGIKTLFETRLTQLTSLASESQDETAFKNKLNDYLLSGPIYNPAATRQIKRLIDNDGKTIYEASTEQEIKIETISLLWKFLTNRIINEEISVDLWIDLYHQFDRLYHEEEELPDEKQVQQWMKRWPSGLNEDVRAIRRQNKERIISLLIQKIENRHAPSSRYLFPEGSTEEDKRRLVCQWWNEARFHLAMAVKNPTELNRMLGNSLSEETLQLYHKARKKGMPVFITPYYLSLLNPTGKGYDDEAIRSYILYSSQLVETYGPCAASTASLNSASVSSVYTGRSASSKWSTVLCSKAAWVTANLTDASGTLGVEVAALTFSIAMQASFRWMKLSGVVTLSLMNLSANSTDASESSLNPRTLFMACW